MSVFVFIVAVLIGLYLYETYGHEVRNSEKELPSSRSSSFDNGSNVDICTIPNCYCKTGNTVFRAFLRSLGGHSEKNNHDLIHAKPSPFQFRAFGDRFKSLNDVTEAIRDAGLESCHLILGIDFTASNEWQGRTTNKGHSLHHVSSRQTILNPYQHVISILDRTLLRLMTPQAVTPAGMKSSIRAKRSQLQVIHAFGFGDSNTKDKSTFPLNPSWVPCCSFEEVQHYYKEAATTVVLDGPTSYAPVITKAIEIVEDANKAFHILNIIADGQFVDEGPTAQAIVKASNYPLSIVVIGVGDGPWGMLMRFDDWLPQRKFDNFQFVEYNKIMKEAGSKNAEAAFALQTLMEIPDQYQTVIDMGYLEKPPNEIHSNHKKKVFQSLRKSNKYGSGTL